MTIELAIKILSDCTSKIAMTRDQHLAVIEALRVLGEAAEANKKISAG